MDAPSTQIELPMDTVANELQQDLSHVSHVAQLNLAQTIEKSNEILDNPQSTKEQLQEALKALTVASGAATLATQSIGHFEKGREMEQQVLAQAAQEPKAEDASQTNLSREDMEANRLDQYCTDLVEIFSKSKKDLKSSATLLAQSPQLDGALAEAYPDASAQQAQQSFWKRVANAALAIEVMIERVRSFPTRLKDNVTSSITTRTQAVSNTVHQFEDRVQREMGALKTGVAAVVDQGVNSVRDKMDYVGAAKDAVVGHYKERSDQLDTFLEEKITGPVFAFVSNAIPKIKSWASSTRDFFQADMFAQDKRSLTEKFQQSVEQRRTKRNPAPVELEEPSTPSI